MLFVTLTEMLLHVSVSSNKTTTKNRHNKHLILIRLDCSYSNSDNTPQYHINYTYYQHSVQEQITVCNIRKQDLIIILFHPPFRRHFV